MTDRTDRNRWIALYVLCTGMLMIVLDVTIVNVALPSIQDDLGFSQSSLAWVVNAYLISFGGLLLLAGRLGDILGRLNMFLAGLGVFTVASLLCGVAQSQELLVGARFLQGVGGAMTSAVILGMIVTMFPEPREQAKAIGAFAFVASAGGSVGLLAGGVLTESINWHWIFFVNVPIAIVTALLARRLLDREKGIGFGDGADAPGAVLITASLMLGVYTIVKPAAELGWTDPQTLGLAAGSLALLAGFIVRESRTEQPADAAAAVPLAQRVGRQHRPGAVGGRDVRDVLPGLPVPAAGAGLRRPGDRPGLHAGDDRDGRVLGALLRAAGDALRRPPDAAPGHGADRGRPARVHPGAGRRQLRAARAAADAAVRPRRRACRSRR